MPIRKVAAGADFRNSTIVPIRKVPAAADFQNSTIVPIRKVAAADGQSKKVSTTLSAEWPSWR